MADAAQLLEFLVGFMIVELLAVILVCLVLLLRTPPEHHHVSQVPDFVPDDWGGDRPQANPAHDPAIERGIQDRRR